MTFASSRQNAEHDQSNTPKAPPLAGPSPVGSPSAAFATTSQDAPIRLHPAATEDPLPARMREHVTVVFAAGQIDETATACARLLKGYNSSAFLWTTLGACHAHRRAFNDALTCFNRARELAPTAPDAYAGMAGVYVQQGKPDAAESHFRTTIGLDPSNVVALNNFANFLTGCGRSDEAAALLKSAMGHAPGNAIVVYNLANALRQLGNTAEAKRYYAQALSLQPDLPEARFNYGQLLCSDQEFEAAAPQFDRLVEANPDDDRARAYKLHIMAKLNDFGWVQEYQAHRRHLGLRGTAVAPFTTLAMEDNPDLLRVRTQAYADTVIIPPLRKPADPIRPASRPERLRIGYFSADFHCHATMFLLGGVLRAHDTSRFDIHAFSYGPQRDDAQRALVQNSVGHFHEAFGLSDQALVDLAKAQNLDIAVDLKGYTGRSRSSIFAQRLAPVQISYLGYPGTMGSPSIDYLITDSVVSPAGTERHFEESLIRMPHSYQPNDPERKVAPRQFTRSDCGLPEDGFIFCCFNNSYKITPREFDIWMPLLTEVEGSVLWLLSSGPASEANLRREAEARGVAAERLVFADRMTQDEHLARQKVADLFLDTFAVNAHTTGSDALWAGLPVLTLPGQQFAARVGASLLNAVNLPELIATDEADYKARALHLAQDPSALMALRSKLNVNRRTAPLFDAKSYTRSLEDAFDAVFDHWKADQPKTHVTVSAAPQPRKAGRAGKKVPFAAA
ncbi:tetratricopeptide repeat protein [Phaeobacter sp. B1627]|uniref:O-linked N-acetylglucosamine transferase, SPINDLY family protein n=1 Tax=Phaeobacter sp. B1627 TaxID=2583809 RepID=UPI00159EEAFA|nr:tetratricopeptide repeat protein [Phaeobacter sp. B1627]